MLRTADGDVKDSGENVEVTGAEGEKNMGEKIESHPEGMRGRSCSLASGLVS